MSKNISREQSFLLETIYKSVENLTFKSILTLLKEKGIPPQEIAHEIAGSEDEEVEQFFSIVEAESSELLPQEMIEDMTSLKLTLITMLKSLEEGIEEELEGEEDNNNLLAFPGNNDTRELSTMVYQLKITLAGSKPPIWRRIEVQADTSLEEFSDIIQRVMGWMGGHLHHFMAHNQFYGQIFENDFMGGDMLNEKEYTIADLLLHEKEKIVYEYDFGDSWSHTILLEKITEERVLEHPICLKGKRACPPEDCGGIWGYESLLEVLSDPKHPEYKEMKEWLDDMGYKNFNSEKFSVAEKNSAFKYMFSK